MSPRNIITAANYCTDLLCEREIEPQEARGVYFQLEDAWVNGSSNEDAREVVSALNTLRTLVRDTYKPL